MAMIRIANHADIDDVVMMLSRLFPFVRNEEKLGLVPITSRYDDTVLDHDIIVAL